MVGAKSCGFGSILGLACRPGLGLEVSLRSAWVRTSGFVLGPGLAAFGGSCARMLRMLAIMVVGPRSSEPRSGLIGTLGPPTAGLAASAGPGSLAYGSLGRPRDSPPSVARILILIFIFYFFEFFQFRPKLDSGGNFRCRLNFANRRFAKCFAVRRNVAATDRLTVEREALDKHTRKRACLVLGEGGFGAFGESTTYKTL